MKHSKFAVGATALLLAIVGAFATRANTSARSFTYYTFNGTPELSLCDNTGVLICKDDQQNILYTSPNKAENPNVLTVVRSH